MTDFEAKLVGIGMALSWETVKADAYHEMLLEVFPEGGPSTVTPEDIPWLWEMNQLNQRLSLIESIHTAAMVAVGRLEFWNYEKRNPERLRKRKR